MKTNYRRWFTLFAFFLLAVSMACSCSSLSSMFTPTPTPTFTPTPRPTPTPLPMLGLEGKWRDQAEGTVHLISWTGTEYAVVSSINDERGAYEITEQTWDGSTLTWTYYVLQTDASVTIQVTSIDNANMYLNWWSSNGNSGTDTFTREP